MIAYVDSSVLLRVALGQPDRLPEWGEIEAGVTSALAEVECLRTLDRRCRQGFLPLAGYPPTRHLALRLLERLDQVEMSRSVLRRAAEPFPTPLGTLDAIHLATALAYREAFESSLVVATHDEELGAAAFAEGFVVVGVRGP